MEPKGTYEHFPEQRRLKSVIISKHKEKIEIGLNGICTKRQKRKKKKEMDKIVRDIGTEKGKFGSS